MRVRPPPGAASASSEAFSRTSPPACESLPAADLSRGSSSPPASQPTTVSPRALRASAAATPQRASPTTRYGPAGTGGLGLPTSLVTCAGQGKRLASLPTPLPDRVGHCERAPGTSPHVAQT